MKNYLFITFLSILAFTNCQKVPVASFTTDKEQYNVGETVKVTNTSKDAYSYKWFVTIAGQQTTSFSESPQIALNEPGSHLITLTCFSKNGKVTNRCSKTVNAISSTGQIVFYQDSPNYTGYSVSLYIDGNFAGTFSDFYSTPPACGAQGCITVTLSEGNHTVEASTVLTVLNSQIVSVISNTCIPYYISN